VIIMRTAILITALFLSAAQSFAAEFPQGSIAMLPTCPGDDVNNVKDYDELGALGAALLTPLLTGTISHGLKAWGLHLQEIAKEQQVDALASGDYFYRAKSSLDAITPRNRCMIVATKATIGSKRTLGQVTAEYRSGKFTLVEGRRSYQESGDAAAGSNALNLQLQKLGFGDRLAPGLLAVFDIEFSPTRAEARLVPRFVVMDHSVREKVIDSKARDMTLEFSLSVPGSEAPFGKFLIKFDGLVAGIARRRANEDGTHDAAVGLLANRGPWFNTPATPTAVEQQLAAGKTAKNAQAEENSNAKFAREAARALKEAIDGDECPGDGEDLELWSKANAQLVVETAKPEAKRDVAKVVAVTQVANYYGACTRVNKASKAIEASKLKAHSAYLPFDVAISVKEFRERPAAKFFGELLADEKVIEGVTSGAMHAIDPGTREADKKAKEAATLTKREAYELALLDADKAQVEVASAKADERAAKELDAQFKKRAANRLANELGLQLPYPDLGLWAQG
jgi:hypothetical protein